MFMVLSSWLSYWESSPGSFDECRTAPSGRRPKTKPDDLGCESGYTGCQNLHPPSPFIIITQPESWYSFYRPTEGRRLSRPSWPVTYRDGLPIHRRSPIQVLTGSDVAQLRPGHRAYCYARLAVIPQHSYTHYSCTHFCLPTEEWLRLSQPECLYSGGLPILKWSPIQSLSGSGMK